MRRLFASLLLVAGCGNAVTRVQISNPSTTTTTTVDARRQLRHVRWMERRNDVLRVRLLAELQWSRA